MTEHENAAVSGWYPTTAERPADAAAWYDALAKVRLPANEPAPPEGPDPAEAARAARKRRRTRTVSVVLCAALLMGAAGTVFARARGLARSRIETAAVSIQSPDPAGEESFRDYRDYFAQTYVGSDRVGIPRTAADAGRTLELRSAAGLAPLSLQEIYAAVSPAVVGVSVTRGGELFGWGTGVLFSPDGYIVTNDHIVSGCDGAVVSLADGTEHEALLIGSDDASDIAVLKIEGRDLPYAVFGDSDELRVGDEVAAIGNPLGKEYAGTMTNGIVSGIDRTLQNHGHSVTLLQTNAALNEGNSGGPLVNTRGQVIGITNMKIMSALFTTVEGIGFAIPSTLVKDVVDELLAGGAVRGKPSLGITAAPVDAEARERFGLPAGVYVATVSEVSRSGLRVGDVITEANGVSVASVPEVNAVKDGFAVGDTLPLTVWRDGRSITVDSVLVDSADVP